jgi:putative intracellular protease/amidase
MIANDGKRPMRMLLLWGDLYGANCTMSTKKLSIVDKFHRYGWELTSAGATRTVEPCGFARERGADGIPMDCTFDEIGDIEEFDGLSVMPGPSHRDLIDTPAVLVMIRRAADAGLVVSGWCRGVRVLASADVLRGRQVVGHVDDRDAIETAGGIYVGHDHPPVIDGRLVTGARSYRYRAKNAEAIRKAMVERLAD